MSLIKDAEVAREIHNEIENLVSLQHRSDIRLGEKLFLIKKGSLYKKAQGEGINTWVDYLRQPEINIPVSRANKLIIIYEHFIIDLGLDIDQIDGTPTYALTYIASKNLTDIDSINDLLLDSRSLTEKDFKEKYHDDIEQTARTYTYLVMRKCVETGSMEKVHGIKSEDIVNKLNINNE